MSPPDIGTHEKSASARTLLAHSISKRILGGGFWSFVSTISANIGGLVASAVNARILGVQQFGLLGMVMNTYAMFGQMGNLGLGVTATKNIAFYRHTDSQRASSIAKLTLGLASRTFLLAALLLAIASGPLAARVLGNGDLSNLLLISSPAILFLGIDAIQTAVLAGLEGFKRLSKVAVARALLAIVASVSMALTFGLIGVVVAQVLVAAIGMLMTRAAMRAETMGAGLNLDGQVKWSELGTVWKVALPAFLAGVLPVPSTWIVNAMLVNQADGFAQMGVFSAAYQWRAAAVLIPVVFNWVALAVHSNLYSNKDKKDYHSSIKLNLMLQTLGAAAIVLVLVIAAPLIMKAYGRGFDGGARVLTCLAIGWLFITPNWIIWSALVSSNRLWIGFGFNLVNSVVLIGGAYRLVGMGGMGLAVAHLVANGLQCLLQLAYYFVWMRKERGTDLSPAVGGL